MSQNRYYLAVETKTNFDSTFDEIKDWFNSARNQTMFDWTEHIIRYDVWHRAFGFMKQFQNVRFIHILDPYWRDQNTLLVNQWDLNEKRKDNQHNEHLLEKLWKK